MCLLLKVASMSEASSHEENNIAELEHLYQLAQEVPIK